MELRDINLKVKNKLYLLISEDHATQIAKILEILNSKDLRWSDLERAKRIANELEQEKI